MNCAEVHDRLHAYADDELDVVRSAEMDEHAKTCAACAAEIKHLRSLRVTLQNSGLAYRAPDALRKKVQQLAREASDREPGRDDRRVRPAKSVEANLQWLWKWLAMGATVTAVLAIVLRPAGISPREQLLNEAVASHVRSLMADHLTDVASSDQHTVKPWFDGKLDFAPNVKDFAEQGFPLVGGRLDYLDGHAVAALVYRHDKHLINVFIWPATNASSSAEATYRGYNVVTCDLGGFHYCLVSDMEKSGLNEFASLIGK